MHPANSSFLTPNYSKGFTLAEVLITLVVLGIVAAITVPTLRNSLDNKKYKVPLKKTYAVLSEAFDEMVREANFAEGDWNFPRPGYFMPFLTDRLAVNKVCCDVENAQYTGVSMQTQDEYYLCFSAGAGKITNSKCFTTPIDPYTEKAPKFFDNKGRMFASFELKDGTSVIILPYGEDFTNENTNIQTVFALSKSYRRGFITGFCDRNQDGCVGTSGEVYYAVFVDVNGKNGPNRPGVDVHAFVYTKSDGLIPAGADYEILGATPSCNEYNWNCTAKFLAEEN